MYYLLYNYHSACRFIAIAPSPGLMKLVTISSSETGLDHPKSVLENIYFSTNYQVHITFLTTKHYDYGSTFSFSINGGFQ